MEYIGELGRLIGLRCASTERVEAAPRYVTESTVEGRRRVQVVPVSPRSWDVQWDLAYPEEVATVAGFAEGAWGNGPWHWVPIQAQHGNLLTPREAALIGYVSFSYVADGGPVRDATGAWSPRSLVVGETGGWPALFQGLPVVPGMPFTWAMDVAGTSPRVQVDFLDVEGERVALESAAGSGTSMQRVALSTTVPAGAASVNVGVSGSVDRATRPQATWTSGPVAYSSGHGCRAAIITNPAEDVLLSTRDRTFTQYGFTVMEVS